VRTVFLLLLVACGHDHGHAPADSGASGADAVVPDATVDATGDAAPTCTQACDSPPPPACADPMTLATSAPAGTCDHGSCTYAVTTSPCAFGCAAGACKPDPCANITCNAPPPPTCSNTATLVTYGAGTCSAGTCHYATTSQTCASGCFGTACVGATTNACGVCDRDWQCDAALDHWSSFYDSQGLSCVDDRTGTSLRCNGSLDNDPDDSWIKTTWGMQLIFGGVLGIHDVDCYPAS
jgi:hypothetical protein